MPNEAHMALRITAAERQIQAILIRLENDLGGKVEQVTVDTRNFANLAVAIFVSKDV